VTGGILRGVVVGGRGGKAVAEVERSEGEATGLEGERSAAGGAAGCGGRGTPPRVDGCRRLEAGRGAVLDGRRYACVRRRGYSEEDCAGCLVTGGGWVCRGEVQAWARACVFRGNGA